MTVPATAPRSPAPPLPSRDRRTARLPPPGRSPRRSACEPFEIADEDRAAYHAAASMASNYLVALEDAAERLLATTGASRAALVPLVRATVENWARDGASTR